MLVSSMNLHSPFYPFFFKTMSSLPLFVSAGHGYRGEKKIFGHQFSLSAVGFENQNPRAIPFSS